MLLPGEAVEQYEVPKVSPLADQVTQCKAKMNEGYPGQTEPDSFPYLPIWIKRSERKEQDLTANTVPFSARIRMEKAGSCVVKVFA